MGAREQLGALMSTCANNEAGSKDEVLHEAHQPKDLLDNNHARSLDIIAHIGLYTPLYQPQTPDCTEQRLLRPEGYCRRADALVHSAVADFLIAAHMFSKF